MDPLARGCVGVLLGVALTGFVVVALESALGWAVVAVLVVLFRPRASAAQLALGLAAGLVLASMQTPGPCVRGPVVVEGRVVGGKMGRTADVWVSRWRTPQGSWSASGGRLRVGFSEVAPGLGQAVRLVGEAQPVQATLLPGEPDPVRGARLGKICTRVWAREAWLAGPFPDEALPEGLHIGLIEAVAMGRRDRVDPAAMGLLRRTGTAHLLAISGFHVGVVAGLVGGVVLALVRRFGVLVQDGIPEWPAWVGGAIAAWLYAAGAGLPLSAQRAATGVTLVVLARLLGRGIRPLSALGVIAVGVVAVDPTALSHPAFQLSFGAVVGLVQLMPVLESWWSRPGKVAEGLRATTAATLGTLPAAAWWFQALSPTSPLANVIAMPWMAVAVVPLAGVGAFAPEPVAGVARWGAGWSIEALLWVLGWLDVAPWAPAVGPLGAAVLTAPLWLPRQIQVWSFALLVGLGLRERPVGTPVLTVLDVGQGTAVVLERADGEVWLIDGGPRPDVVLRYLRRRGLRHLQRVVVSHPDKDHLAGLVPVLQQLRVDAVWVADRPAAEVVREAVGVELPLVVGPQQALHPKHPERWGQPNDRSLVVHLPDGGGIVLPGDISSAVEPFVDWPEARVLVLPHHGSRDGSGDMLLERVRPELAIATVGRNNFYGHPHQQVVKRVAAHGVPLMRTDTDGVVQIRLGEVLEVRTWQAGRGWQAAELAELPGPIDMAMAKPRR